MAALLHPRVRPPTWLGIRRPDGAPGVMLAFLLIVLHSSTCTSAWRPSNRHLQAPAQRSFGPRCHWMYHGELLDLDDPLGGRHPRRGKIEDFTWKGNLDMATCTERGRCQSQCPAWNTGKPLSPARHHGPARPPVPPRRRTSSAVRPMNRKIWTWRRSRKRVTTSPNPASAAFPARPEQAVRPLVGTAEQGGGDRPRRAVVLHHLRRLRRAVPGRHRAHRPHRTCAVTRC